MFLRKTYFTFLDIIKRELENESASLKPKEVNKTIQEINDYIMRNIYMQ